MLFVIYLLQDFEQSNTVRGRFCIPCRDDGIFRPDPEYTVYGSIIPHAVSVCPLLVRNIDYCSNSFYTYAATWFGINHSWSMGTGKPAIVFLNATFICSVIGSVQCFLTGYNSSKRLCDHNISLDHHHGFAHDRCCYWGCTCCEI